MIFATANGDVELRSEFGSSSDIRAPWSAWASSSGLPVTTSLAFGLPAVSNVIRSPAEIVASLPMFVYKGDPRERADTSWQWKLLHDQPSSECDPFEFFYDLVLSVEATQNAFVQKAKFNDRVYELYVLDPQRVTVRRDEETGEKRFDVYVSNGRIQKDLTTGDILHVRGFSMPGSIAGISLIQVHKDPLAAAVAMQTFEGDYFKNSGVPPFWFTGAQNANHAKEIIDSHKRNHTGSGSQHKPGALWGNIDVKSIPISMADAAYIENKHLSVEDVCRIWRWPKELLEFSSQSELRDENQWTAKFLKFYLLPRLRRIELAFNSDSDLFPPAMGRRAKLFTEFLTAALERADYTTRVRGYKDARQGSWITANEIRQMENLPPLDGGDELQLTPVGGAPNPPGGSNENPEAEE
jgi:HK97 family phage portal protein